MDLLSLPVTVQRRIALLLEQSDAAEQDGSTEADGTRLGSTTDQSASERLSTHHTDVCHIRVNPHEIASRLLSAPAAVVESNFLGSELLQVQFLLPSTALCFTPLG